MKAITVVVFDLDGTLIDSAPDLQSALNEILAEERLRPLRLDEVVAIVGDGAAVLVQRALALAGSDDAEDGADRLTRRFLARYEERAADLTRPYPRVPETLAHLRQSGFALGICTNKPERATRAILDRLELSRYFQAVIGGDTLDGVRKPDPRHLEAALTALGGTPAGSAMVGDSVNDVAAARGLGIPIIVRAGGYGPLRAETLGADAVIHEFDELPDAIGRLS